MMADMVNLHFLSVIEALLECKSTSLSKLLPLWRHVLQSDNSQVGIRFLQSKLLHSIL